MCLLVSLFLINFQIVKPVLTKFSAMVKGLTGEILHNWKPHQNFENLEYIFFSYFSRTVSIRVLYYITLDRVYKSKNKIIPLLYMLTSYILSNIYLEILEKKRQF
jgi:hypothetical protein